ncbi:ABC transporter substrate-binding protein [Chitinibacter sp. GC72]|uniref:substrate-binding periplasmic protein n=1 Tax=Chitinibacter sp. GC72 TaxID=1526917 RepID=UPI0012FAA1F4|nr:transporter substrate-binding domain-containing protein [Chitinibacter sp. GC72]
MVSRLITYFSCGLTLAMSTTAQADLTFYVGDNPPFNEMVGKMPKGLAVDIVEQMLKRAQITYKYQESPWARALFTTQNEANTCIFSLGRIPQREGLFTWIGPIAQNKWALFTLKNKKIQLKSLDEAKKYPIGGQRKDAKMVFLEGKGFTVDLATEEDQTMKKLYAGHLDLIAGGLYTAKKIARDLGFDPESIKPVLVFNTVENYIGCSKSTDPKMIEALNSALSNMQSDGSLKKITDQHIQNFE